MKIRKRLHSELKEKMEYRIVKKAEDIALIEALAREIFEEFYYPQMPKKHIKFFIDQFQTAQIIKEQINSNFEYYLIGSSTEHLGYLGLEFKDSKMILSKLYIKKNARSLKLGDLGMQLAKKRASEKNKTVIDLFVNHLNSDAIRFYKRHGFTEVKKVLNKYENGHSETDLLMRITITQQ